MLQLFLIVSNGKQLSCHNAHYTSRITYTCVKDRNSWMINEYFMEMTKSVCTIKFSNMSILNLKHE